MSNDGSLRILLVGSGQIASEIVRCALAQGHEIVGAVDVDASKVGRDVGDVLGIGSVGVSVVGSVDACATAADVAVVATSSSLAKAESQFLDCIRLGLDVVSTCEELVYPWSSGDVAIARALDDEARLAEVTLIGAGINPGFVLDTLALALSAPCTRVWGVRARRILDAGQRRASFREKVGVGLTEDEFVERAATGDFGHAGLDASAWMIADRLRLPVNRLQRSLDPISDGATVRGTRQVVTLHYFDQEVVRLEMTMAVDVDNPEDAIELLADPPVRITIPGGVPGDAGTAGVIVNVARYLSGARPGLLTMADLPVVHAGAAARPTAVPALEDR